MLSMGDEDPPVPFRIFWGITEGMVAAVLMLAGGLNALQTASIVAGLPIAVILILMAYGMVKTLEEDFPALDVEDRRELEYLNL
jgi:choline/glycine/proline betaine transport protein